MLFLDNLNSYARFEKVFRRKQILYKRLRFAKFYPCKHKMSGTICSVKTRPKLQIFGHKVRKDEKDYKDLIYELQLSAAGKWLLQHLCQYSFFKVNSTA